MKWLERKRQEVMDKWRRDEIAMCDAAGQLVALGYSSSDAWTLLSK